MKIKGFTLSEMLVAVAIFLIAILALFAMMDMGRTSWFTGDTSAQLRQEVIRALTVMEKEIKETRPAQVNLTAGAASASLTLKIPHDNDGNGTVLDSTGNIEWSTEITYALNGAGEVTRTSSGITTILAHNIVSLQFTRPVSPVNILQIDIAARKNTVMGKTIQDLDRVVVKMRN